MTPLSSCNALQCVERWALSQELPQLQVFEKLWGTNELLSSFDSINCLPPSTAMGVPNDQSSWLHADQAPLRRGFFCIQVSCAGHETTDFYRSVMVWVAVANQTLESQTSHGSS